MRRHSAALVFWLPHQEDQWTPILRRLLALNRDPENEVSPRRFTVK